MARPKYVNTQAKRDHAVVLGASMAGLLTARVLADHFTKVTVVDRDPLDRPGPRRGVPQGRHAHGLLSAGLQVIEELFPGATEDLVNAGVPSGDVLRNVRFCIGGHHLKQVPVGTTALSFSRPYFEDYLRRRLLDRPAVELLPGHDVLGVEAGTQNSRVIGARVQPRAEGGAARVLPADLVVDATGRGSRAGRWLAELGYPPPEREQLLVDAGYTSRRFKLRGEATQGDIAIVVGPAPWNTRGGAVQLQEEGRAIITLFGVLGDHAPTDDAGFRAYAESLPLPYVADALRDATPLDGPYTFKYPGSTRYRYDKLRRFPAGFVVVGDAMCSFNPMYGQGMSVAAVEALALGKELAGELDALRFFRAVRPTIDVPWQIATGGDAALPGVDGPDDARTRFVNRYLTRLYSAAAQDEVVSLAFSRVTNLLAPPGILLKPGIAMRVFRHRPKKQPVLETVGV
jgi:2-polyprenyl-6-methoxyphenol hydroxylase-like FAD-dependent oxidoreductase